MIVKLNNLNKIAGLSGRLALMVGLGALLLLPVGLCIAYVQREYLLAKWRTDCWVSSDEASMANERGEKLRKWLTNRPQVSVPLLITHFADAEPVHAARAGRLIREIFHTVDPHDPELVQVSLSASAKVHHAYLRLPAHGREEAVELAYRLLDRHLGQWSPHVPTVLDAAGEILAKSLDDEDRELKRRSVERMADAWRWIKVDGVCTSLVREWMLELYRDCARALDSDDPQIRSAAVGAVSSAPFHDEDDKLAALLEDTDEAVRQRTLFAIARDDGVRLRGSAQRRMVAPFLNDDNPECVRAAARILRSAGIPENRIELIRSMNSKKPNERATAAGQAVRIARDGDPGFDPHPILMKLRSDPSAQVRRSFATALFEWGQAGTEPWRGILERMHREDPDEETRQRIKAQLKK